jgi:hypothetical protein
MRTPSIASLFRTFETASTHNCSSIPHHNSAPPLPRVISLHAHSIIVAIHSFLYNISHTQREISHALPCSNNGEATATKEMANQVNLISKIRKCSHWCGDLILCYICNPFVFEKLSPLASLSLVECDRSGDLDETFPTNVHQHLGQCIADYPLQSQSFPSHQYAR